MQLFKSTNNRYFFYVDMLAVHLANINTGPMNHKESYEFFLLEWPKAGGRGALLAYAGFILRNKH